MDSLWTPELYQEASEKYQFIVVTPIGLARVNVTDIRPIFALHKDFIFNPKFRIAGTRDDIIKQMNKAGYEPEDLDVVIADIDNTSITSDNIESLVNEDGHLLYDIEEAEYEQWKRQLIEEKSEQKGLTLVELLKMINPHMSVIEEKKVFPRIPVSTTKTTTTSKPTVSPTKGKVGRKSTGLQEKVDKALDDDKLINVSKITTSGTGTVMVPKRAKTSLFVAPSLPITSNNLEAFLIAIDLLGGEEEYPDDVQEARDFNWKKDSSSPKSTPTKTTTTSTPTGRTLITQSKTVVPEAAAPVRKGLLPPPGKRPTTLVVPENTDI